VELVILQIQSPSQGNNGGTWWWWPAGIGGGAEVVVLLQLEVMQVLVQQVELVVLVQLLQ
jgi:hypothetical protein